MSSRSVSNKKQDASAGIKEPTARKVFSIFAAIAGVFGVGLDIEGTHPTIGICLMLAAIGYMFWELFTSPVAAQKIPVQWRAFIAVIASILLLWVSWPDLKSVIFPDTPIQDKATVPQSLPLQDKATVPQPLPQPPFTVPEHKKPVSKVTTYRLDFPKPALGQSEIQNLSEDAGTQSGDISICIGDVPNTSSYCSDVYGIFVIQFRNKLRNAGVTIDALEDAVGKIKKGPSANELREAADLLDAISQRLAKQATEPVEASASSNRVDWHDKKNWRSSLRTGMTKTEVRLLFGESEKMRVFGNLETWEYGTGEITFFTDSKPDGSLYSWREPN